MSADDVSDDPRYGAKGMRQSARWIASAFGGIPSLALLGALVRAPGDAGFDHKDLAWGVSLAAAGAVIGVLGYAYVLRPVEVSDDDLTNKTFKMSRVAGSPFAKVSEFREALTHARHSFTDEEAKAKSADVDAKSADAEASMLEAAAEAADKAADQADETHAPAAKKRAAAAWQTAREHRDIAAAAAGTAAARAREFQYWSDQRTRYEKMRSDALLLRASDKVDVRYQSAQLLTFVAVAAVALGIILLALAPNKKAVATSPAPSLVTLDLTEAGTTALGCAAGEHTKHVTALKVGGTEQVPNLIILPGNNCKVVPIAFKQTTTKAPALGKVTTVKPAEPK